MVIYNNFIDNIGFYFGTMKNHKKWFFVFKKSLLTLNQLFKEISSVFSLSIRLFMWLPLINIQISSEYNILKSIGETLHILLTNIIKSSGPRIDPWGTPHLIPRVSDTLPSKLHRLWSVS